MKNKIIWAVMILFGFLFIGCGSSPFVTQNIMVSESTPLTEKSQILTDKETYIDFFDDIRRIGTLSGLVDIPAGQHKIGIFNKKNMVYDINFLPGKCYLIPILTSNAANTPEIEEIGNARWNMPIIDDLTMNPGESIIIFHGNFPLPPRNNYLLLLIDDEIVGPVGPTPQFPNEILKIRVPNGSRKISVQYPYVRTETASIDIDCNSEVIDLVIKNSWPLAVLSIVKK